MSLKPTRGKRFPYSSAGSGPIDEVEILQQVQNLEELIKRTRHQRAVDIWAATYLKDVDIVPAINAALADGQLDGDELVGLLLHLGYVLPRGIDPCHVLQLATNQGGGLNVMTHSERGARVGFACFRAPSDTVGAYSTAARIEAENKPPLTPEQADAAFEGIDEL